MKKEDEFKKKKEEKSISFCLDFIDVGNVPILFMGIDKKKKKVHQKKKKKKRKTGS